MTQQKYALITGASAGLGKVFAERLAAQGFGLVLIARNPDKLRTVAENLAERFNVPVTKIPADMSKSGTPDMIRAVCDQDDLQIDFLINNAGSSGPDLLEEHDWSVQEDFYRLMMTSYAQMCHLFVPDMRKRKWGRVINVASVAGRLPSAGGCNYGPTKAYVVALSEDLNLTVGSDGVNVCALCPGFTHTDFHETAGMMSFKEKSPKWLWYSADTVVEDGLKAVETGKPICISGRLYRWLDPLLQSVWTRRFFRQKATPQSIVK